MISSIKHPDQVWTHRDEQHTSLNQETERGDTSGRLIYLNFNAG